MTTQSNGSNGASTAAATLVSKLRQRVRATPAATAFRTKVGGTWVATPWGDVAAMSDRVAAGLMSLGITRGDRVAIISQTRPEWLLADFGIVCAGGATVTVYPSNLPHECAYILSHSECRAAIVEDVKQLRKLREVAGELPQLAFVVCIDGGDGEAKVGGADVFSWQGLLARGDGFVKANPSALKARGDEVTGDDTACLIYTSGTTGNPKGVIIPHAAFALGMESVAKSLPAYDEGHETLLFLPLAHSFAKLIAAASLEIAFVIWFAESLDKLRDNLAEARPTFLAAVPRVFEKIHQGIQNKVHDMPPRRQKIFRWAVAQGVAATSYRERGAAVPALLGLKLKVADRLVFAKLRAVTGGRVRGMVSGGAPLSPEICRFFHAVGLPIYEGYGLTETNSVTSVNREGRFRIGTVGLAHHGVEIKIADDGEILQRGPTIMRGYYKNPEATAEAIDGEGWFHTGDIGEMDADGFIKITDRKKDILKTSGGKMVSPQNIENELKLSPYISQAVVHGDKRKYLTLLVTLDKEAIEGWAARNGVTGLSWAALCGDARVKALVQGEVDKLNAHRAKFETVKHFAIVPDEFSQETGELTPSLKVKRKFVNEKYKAIFDSFYEGDTAEL